MGGAVPLGLCACLSALLPEALQPADCSCIVTNFHGTHSTPQNVIGHTNAGDSQQGTRCHKRGQCTQCCAAKGQLAASSGAGILCFRRSTPVLVPRQRFTCTSPTIGSWAVLWPSPYAGPGVEQCPAKRCRKQVCLFFFLFCIRPSVCVCHVPNQVHH
jgi:hypothetical protein